MIAGSEIRIKHFTELPSTNDTAKLMAEEGAPEGLVVRADRQTAGRGRFERKWESPAGKGLWFSLVLRPRIELKRIGLINVFTALFLRNIIDRLLRETPGKKQINVYLKWPNDILIGTKKVCGILLESSSRFNKVEYLIVGVGLNVLQTRGDFGEEIRNMATSLKMESGRDFQLSLLLDDIVNGYFSDYRQAVEENFSGIIPEYERHLLYLYQEIQVQTLKGRISGKMIGVDENGFLRLETASGEMKITAGDIWTDTLLPV